MPNEIVKGRIGNALMSVAPDHILGVANDIFDEELQMYQSEINKLSGVYDISVAHASEGTPATYADLTAALGNGGANVPSNVRKPGMSVKFINSTTGQYEQYRLMSPTWSISVSNWQGVDEVPTPESKNLVESGGVAKKRAEIKYFINESTKIAIWEKALQEIYIDDSVLDFTNIFLYNGYNNIVTIRVEINEESYTEISVNITNGEKIFLVNNEITIGYIVISDIQSIAQYPVGYYSLMLLDKILVTNKVFHRPIYKNEVDTENLKNHCVNSEKVSSDIATNGRTTNYLYVTTGAKKDITLHKGDIIESIGTLTSITLTKANDTNTVVNASNLPFTIDSDDYRKISAYTNPSREETIIIHIPGIDDKINEIENKLGNVDELLEEINGSSWDYLLSTTGGKKDIALSKGEAITSIGTLTYIVLTKADNTDVRVDLSDLPYEINDDNYRKISAYTSPSRIETIVIEKSGIKDSIEKNADDIDDLQREITEIENEGVQVCLPSIITAIEGDTLQIFHRSVIKAVDPYNYSIVVVCDYGKNFPRYYEFTPQNSQLNTQKQLVYNVYDNKNNLVASKSAILNVVSKPSSPSSLKNILLVGDSVFAGGGTVADETSRRLMQGTGDGTPLNPTGLNLSNIAFVGRKETRIGVHQEATGGWSWKKYGSDTYKDLRFYIENVNLVVVGDTYTIQNVSASSTYYLTVVEVNIDADLHSGYILCEVYGGYVYPSGVIPASGTLIKKTGNGDNSITYTSFLEESGNPFWNVNKIDFVNYSLLYCNSANIDYLVVCLGINDFRSESDVDVTFDNYIKPFVSQFHADFPNGKVIIGTLQLQDPTGGLGSNNGASDIYNWYRIASIYWYYVEKLKEMNNSGVYSSYMFVSDVCGEFDCENVYPYRNANVNNRTPITEKLGTNPQHPTDYGKKQIADSLYRTICSLL